MLLIEEITFLKKGTSRNSNANLTTSLLFYSLDRGNKNIVGIDSPHSFRHSLATHLLELEQDIRTVQ